MEKKRTKLCIRCGKRKSVEKFYVNQRAKDGCRSECIECTRAMVMAYRKKKLAKRARDKAAVAADTDVPEVPTDDLKVYPPNSDMPERRIEYAFNDFFTQDVSAFERITKKELAGLDVKQIGKNNLPFVQLEALIWIIIKILFRMGRRLGRQVIYHEMSEEMALAIAELVKEYMKLAKKKPGPIPKAKRGRPKAKKE